MVMKFCRLKAKGAKHDCAAENQNAKSIYQVSVPGSLMLMGEHAVLRGKMALVCALDKCIHVTLTPRHDDDINIVAATHGKLTVALSELQITSPFTFVTAAIVHLRDKLKHGFDLNITSDFSCKMGLGSSAAVTVATLVALQLYLGIYAAKKRRQLLLAARQVIRSVQGFGSGADAAASIYGGVVAYRAAPLDIKKIASSLPLTVIYSGKKVATVEVIKQVAALRAQHIKTFALLDNALESCVKEALQAIVQQDWVKLGETANIHHGLQAALGTSTATLSAIVFALRCARNEGIYGAKISGSGLGDCVIGIGEVASGVLAQKAAAGKEWQEVAVKVSAAGIVIREASSHPALEL